MTTKLADILGSEALPAEMLSALQEAFDAKIAETKESARAEAEIAIREEMAARFDHDKAALVEAMNLMLTDAVKANARKQVTEAKKLAEARAKLDKALAESKTLYVRKLREHVETSSTFVATNLKSVIVSLSEKKAELAAKQVQLETAYAKLKTTLAEQQAARLQKMDEFVVRRLTHELTELHEDHRALNETRANLIREQKEKIKASQAKFVAEAAKKVEAKINETLKHEMREMHEDIERNRQNTFGRRIFEAMAAEYGASYYNDGSEARKLQAVLESKEQELASIKTKLDETVRAAETAGRKEKLAEDRATRTKILSELLNGLRGEKRSVMASMLESTKTEALRATYDRMLPIVLSEKAKTAVERKGMIAETARPARRVVEVSGDKPVRQLDSASENEINAEMDTILALAGLRK